MFVFFSIFYHFFFAILRQFFFTVNFCDFANMRVLFTVNFLNIFWNIFLLLCRKSFFAWFCLKKSMLSQQKRGENFFKKIKVLYNCVTYISLHTYWWTTENTNMSWCHWNPWFLWKLILKMSVLRAIQIFVSFRHSQETSQTQSIKKVCQLQTTAAELLFMNHVNFDFCCPKILHNNNWYGIMHTDFYYDIQPFRIWLWNTNYSLQTITLLKMGVELFFSFNVAGSSLTLIFLCVHIVVMKIHYNNHYMLSYSIQFVVHFSMCCLTFCVWFFYFGLNRLISLFWKKKQTIQKKNDL